jgi:hypothetical protein
MPYNDQNRSPKPYKLVSFPSVEPSRKRPKGQHLYHQNCLTGSIKLTLTVKNALFTASGLVAMGGDISPQYQRIPLIKLGVTKDNIPIIQGSSFKGVLRSIYEAITASCLCNKMTAPIPNGYQKCDLKKDHQVVCPACRIFGAMGWQGLITFQDAIAQNFQSSIGFMPSLYSPNDNRESIIKMVKLQEENFIIMLQKLLVKEKLKVFLCNKWRMI